MNRVVKIVAAVALFALLPTLAFAQATIAGVVRDASAAVLPGVSVEVTSPVLIEKIRTVVSDGTGQYRITDLPPGTYAMTFSLTGFTTVKREGLEVSGSGVITSNAELRVGTVQETVTVTDLEARFMIIPPGPWPDPPHSALIVPIRANKGDELAGLLVMKRLPSL